MLNRRVKQGKEDPERLDERMGSASAERPGAPLIWLHAASVGEAQSMLILIESLQERHKDTYFLVTTGTVTSAALMAKRLPRRSIHQYYPIDHPVWVERFLDHWRPDAILWMESEIWPNMIMQIRKRDIPAAIVNARLSEKSFMRWQKAGKNAEKLLSVFNTIMTQTEEAADYFRKLGANNVIVTGNLKYSATPLPADKNDLENLRQSIGDRPLWVYASTHDGEEELACRLHQHIGKQCPDLLTIIVPRHPDRRDYIARTCAKYDMQYKLRNEKKNLPLDTDQIYIADTLGEMGLFYELAPIACIGRSFSKDGGGGHNPIEAAQKYCAVLHGPRIQNLQQIYDEMDNAGAAINLRDEKDFETRLLRLLKDEEGLIAMQNRAHRFVSEKANVITAVLEHIPPLLKAAHEDTTEEKKQCV